MCDPAAAPSRPLPTCEGRFACGPLSWSLCVQPYVQQAMLAPPYLLLTVQPALHGRFYVFHILFSNFMSLLQRV